MASFDFNFIILHVLINDKFPWYIKRINSKRTCKKDLNVKNHERMNITLHSYRRGKVGLLQLLCEADTGFKLADGD